jgi:Holliday junction DNA helicase RuvA
LIAYLSGNLLEKLEASVVVDTGGVGYEVFLPSNSRVFLKNKGDEVVLQTAQIVKEDDIALYGFEDRASLRLFRLLITVSGVGAKAAMSILSAMPTDDAVRAIAFGDAAMLTRANGVGKKSAERVVLELKEKVTAILSVGGAAGQGPSASVQGAGTGGRGLSDEAILVLMGFGYSRSEAAQAVLKVQDEYDTVEACVKLALKNM